MAALDVGTDVPLDHHIAGRGGALIGGNPHEIHLAGCLDLPDHIGVKDDNAFQHAYNDGVFVPVITVSSSPSS